MFIADTCIGGLSVVRSMWASGSAGGAVFMADYAVNPLGVKSDGEIAAVVDSWIRAAEAHSQTLVIACNTLSIRYRQLARTGPALTRLKHIVSMVDCFTALARAEAQRLADRKVLIIGTEFTARQPDYPEILNTIEPSARVSTIGATELERKIARMQADGDAALLDDRLSQAIAATDVAVLACTCFPMVQERLQALFPHVVFLDPGAYCAGLLQQDELSRGRTLAIRVTGDVVSKRRVAEFAKTYLGSDYIATL